MPLSESELVGLLHRPPDLGPLVDPARRASCLAGLGYPASTPVLGARQIRMEGRDAVILVLAADAAPGADRGGGAGYVQRGRHRTAGRHHRAPALNRPPRRDREQPGLPLCLYSCQLTPERPA